MAGASAGLAVGISAGCCSWLWWKGQSIPPDAIRPARFPGARLIEANRHQGRLDTRYQGPDYNRLSEEADYDPQSNAISSAYSTAINHYLRTELKYGETQTYKPTIYRHSRCFVASIKRA